MSEWAADDIVLASMAVAMVVGALVELLRGLFGRRSRGTRSTGTAVGFDDALLYHPIIEFEDAEGTPTRFVATSGAGGMDLGEQVPVRYDHRRPRRADIDLFDVSILTPVYLLMISLGVLAVTWITIDRQHAVSAKQRVAAYQALQRATTGLRDCADRSCRPRALRSRLRAYDRARAVAAPLATAAVKSHMTKAQAALVSTRRAGSKPTDAALAGLWWALVGEMLELAVDCDATDARC